MQYRQLGNSTLKTSVVGLGALHFGVFLNQEETTSIVHHAVQHGVNFIDTAPMYGNGLSESFLGNALKGLRDKVIITTKAGLEPVLGQNGSFGVKVASLKRKYIRNSIENSLRALGTDYIDLFQLHAFDWHTPFEETMEELEALVKEGKIRFIGCSNYNSWELKTAISVTERNIFTPFIALQCHYNMIERRARKELLPVCNEKGIGVICNRSLARGVLTGKYKYRLPLPECSRAASSSRIRRWLSKEILELVSELEGFAWEHNRSATELALAWLLRNPRVSVVLVGVRTIEQLKTCRRAADWFLSAKDLWEIDMIIENKGLTHQVDSFPEAFLEK